LHAASKFIVDRLEHQFHTLLTVILSTMRQYTSPLPS
jgi:hypothetical protein